MVHIVGAGSGAVDLITLRGKKLLEEADVVIYAGSLVNPELLKFCKSSAEIFNSAEMTLEEIVAVIEKAERENKTTVRLHTGDPSIYGAIKEQMKEFEKRNISCDICPGVSSMCGAAAALKAEFTPPGASQTIIISRVEGNTPVPEKESIAALASHNATMVLFLSAKRVGALQEELVKGGYPQDTPAAIVYKATWPDEKVLRCTVASLAETAKKFGITKTALIVVGEFLGGCCERSHLYNPIYSTDYRKAKL